MKRIHIDIETLGVTHQAPILSIGACVAGDMFYVEIDQESYREYTCFTSDKEAMEWWEKQGGFIPSMPLIAAYRAIEDFSTWIDNLRLDFEEEFEIWANSSYFDITILEYHMRVFNVECPWNFREVRDLRTLRKMYECSYNTTYNFNNNHNALDDAVNQENACDYFLRALNIDH